MRTVYTAAAAAVRSEQKSSPLSSTANSFTGKGGYGHRRAKCSDITGGEPLLRKEFFDIMGAAHELGFSWGMTSNATLIDDSVAKDLKKVGIGTISVSIDGLEQIIMTLSVRPPAVMTRQ